MIFFTEPVRQLVALASDAEPDALHADIVGPELRDAVAALELKRAEIDRVRERLAQQITAAADATRARLEATEGLAAADLESATAIEDADIKRTAARLKKAASDEQAAQQAEQAADRLLGALKGKLAHHEAELQSAIGAVAPLLVAHRSRLANLVANELRAAVQGLAPLFKLAAAVAHGTQDQGLLQQMREMRIPPLTGANAYLLDGFHSTDPTRMVSLAGSGLEFPTRVDLVEGWADDPVLQAITRAAGQPLRVEREARSYVPYEVQEQQRIKEEREAEQRAQRFPSGSGPRDHQLTAPK
jgi:hypothetical protein